MSASAAAAYRHAQEHGDGVDAYDYRHKIGVQWFGIIAPGGTPALIIERLHAEIVKALKEPSVIERLRDYEIFGSSPAEFAAFIAKDIEKTAKVIRASGAKVD